MRVSELREEGEAMNVPEKLEVPVVVKDTDGNEHEVERLVYRLERNGKSRWAELFGTPERAARTMGEYCYNMVSCAECGIRCEGKRFEDGDALLEWLNGDA